jgi:preprotein translocase subunit SecA
MFEELTSTIQAEFVRYIYRVELVRPEQPQRRAAAQKVAAVRERHGDEEDAQSGAAQDPNPNQVISDKVPRNAPCPCGSGRKYKKCHGAVASGRSAPRLGATTRRRGRRFAPAPSTLR